MKRTKSINVAVVIGGTLFEIAFLAGLVMFAGFYKFGSSYNVSAYVYNARGIAQYSTVFEAGLPVGIVTGVDRSGPDAILQLRIDKGVKPLTVDSQIQLGLRSLAGESDVILSHGHSTQMVRNGGSLGLSHDQSYTEVDQILNALAGPTEGAARSTLQGLGDSVRGQGQNLNQTIGGFAGLVNNSEPLTSILGHQRGQVADLVQYFGNVMGAIGQRTSALQQFAQGALTTFNTVAARDTALRGMFKEYPYAINAVAATGAALAKYEPGLTRVVDHLSKVVRDLSPTVPLIAPGAENGVKIIGALGSAAPQLKNVLISLKQLQPAASKALPAVHALTCQADPMLRFLSPYGQDIVAFLQDFGAADSFYSSSAGGHELPGVLHVDPKALVRGVFGQPANSAITSLVNFGVLRLTGAQPTYYHALRPPGQRNNTSFGAGNFTPAQFGASHPYPHVTADCTR